MNIASTLAELWISSKEEYRLYLELKRIAKELEIKTIESIPNNKGETPVEFVIQNVALSMNNNKINISKGDKIESIDKKEFLERPRTIIKKLRNFLQLE